MRGILFLLGSTLLAQQTIPVPKFTGPIPVTANAHPLLAADHNLQPLDLSKFGYVEEEYIVSGAANVYDWAENNVLTVKTANAPYATRILVRRPANASKFSGTVVVEPLGNPRKFDWSLMFGYLHDQIFEHGDAWVGITMPGAVDALKAFNPSRYAAVSFANPISNATCPAAEKDAKPTPAPIEEGLRWDAISQVAALIKSNVPGRPFASLRVQSLFLTTQFPDITTYLGAFHSYSRLANGKPAYDGYLLRNPPAPAKINQCAAAPALGDPRRTIRDVDVPVVAVTAQGEVPDSLPMRKTDSDDPKGRYRLYEIAGAAHIDRNAYDYGFPSPEDQAAAIGAPSGTVEWPFTAPCDPPITLSTEPLLSYAYHAALLNLDQWVRTGIAPPKASRIQVKEGRVILDKSGNGVAGVRSPYVDFPSATYLTTSPGPGNCRELGRIVPLPQPAKTSRAQIERTVDSLVKGRLFTESDGQRMKDALH